MKRIDVLEVLAVLCPDMDLTSVPGNTYNVIERKTLDDVARSNGWSIA